MRTILYTLLLSLPCVTSYAATQQDEELISRGGARGGGGYRGGGERGRSPFDENVRRYDNSYYGGGYGGYGHEAGAYERGLNTGLNEGDAAGAGAEYVDPYPYDGYNWNYGYPPPVPQNPASEQYSQPAPQNY